MANKYTSKSSVHDDMMEHKMEDRKIPEAGLKAAKAKSKTPIKGNTKTKAKPAEDYSAGVAAATAKTRLVKKGY